METTVTDFWCEKCRLDVRLIAQKGTISKRDFWIAACPKCGRRLLRYCKDPILDPYYRLSQKVQMERIKYAKDLLQPGDPEFDRVYPQHKKEREARAEAEEKEKWEKKQKNE